MNSEASDRPVPTLDLSGMQARPYVESDPPNGIPDETRTTHCPRRPVEGREEPVPCRIHLDAPELRERAAHLLMVAVEHVALLVVPGAARMQRRADDVSEQHGRERPVGIHDGALPGEELLDLPQHRVWVPEERQEIITR